MKKSLFVVALGAMLTASCVSLSEFENLQTKYDQTTRQYNLTRQELDELREISHEGHKWLAKTPP